MVEGPVRYSGESDDCELWSTYTIVEGFFSDLM